MPLRTLEVITPQDVVHSGKVIEVRLQVHTLKQAARLGATIRCRLLGKVAERVRFRLWTSKKIDFSGVEKALNDK